MAPKIEFYGLTVDHFTGCHLILPAIVPMLGRYPVVRNAGLLLTYVTTRVFKYLTCFFLTLSTLPQTLKGWSEGEGAAELASC